MLIKHCFLIGENTVQAKQWRHKCYSDSALLETMVKSMYADFKRGHTNMNDGEHSGHPNSTVIPEPPPQKKLHKFV